jgi:hypothetical protein
MWHVELRLGVSVSEIHCSLYPVSRLETQAAPLVLATGGI